MLMNQSNVTIMMEFYHDEIIGRVSIATGDAENYFLHGKEERKGKKWTFKIPNPRNRKVL